MGSDHYRCPYAAPRAVRKDTGLRRALAIALLVVASLFVHAPVHAEPASPEFVYSVVCAPEYEWDCATAVAIIERESGFDSFAVNPSSFCVGWWQFYPGHGLAWEVMTDPYLSTQVAYSFWLARQWRDWE